MKSLGLAAGVAALAFAGAANATIVTVFNTTVANGVANFNSTVTGAGGTATADTLNGLSDSVLINRTDYTIQRIDGSTADVRNYGTLSGQVISIDPDGTGPGVDAKGSGVKFTFNTPVNAIGFEVGDWGTCCQPSALYISFGNGAPIQVGISTVVDDVEGPNGNEVFVAAFDDTGDFTEVFFWGDGFGEVLVAGGTIRYALLDQGSLPPTGVPEPATLALLGAGLAGIGVMRRRRKA